MFGVITRAAPRRGAVSLRYLSQAKVPKPPQPPVEESKSNAATEEMPPTTPSETPTKPLSAVPSLDFSPLEEPQTTGARSNKNSLSSMERRRQTQGRVFTALFVLGLGLNTIYMGREWEPQELEDKKMTLETAPKTRWSRALMRYGAVSDVFVKPSWPELLPPTQAPPLQKPYTLLISLDDLLVTGIWDRTHGWRTAKRPGVDYFLAYISQFYEVVIFTTQHSFTALPIVEKLDRYQFFVQYKLCREATSSVGGKIVKDLTYLNRDLSKVITLDTDPEHVATHPENAIILPKWKGEPKDGGLIAMIPFLESIAIYKPADVRPIIAAYKDKNIPVEYAKKEAEAKERHIAEWNNKKGASGGFGLSGLIGGGSQSSSANSRIPPTYLEQKRAEAQANYREEQAYIASHKEEFEELLRKDQEAMAASGPGSLWEMLGGPGAKKEGEDKGKSAGVDVPVVQAEAK